MATTEMNYIEGGGTPEDFVYIAKISAANKGNKITTGWKPTKIMWVCPNATGNVVRTIAFYYDEADGTGKVSMTINGTVYTDYEVVEQFFTIDDTGITYPNTSPYYSYTQDVWVMLGR